MKNAKSTQYLASFMIGMGSILNIAPVVTTPNFGGTNDDFSNVKKDWQEVGHYLSQSMKQEQVNDRW